MKHTLALNDAEKCIAINILIEAHNVLISNKESFVCNCIDPDFNKISKGFPYIAWSIIDDIQEALNGAFTLEAYLGNNHGEDIHALVTEKADMVREYRLAWICEMIAMIHESMK